MNRRLGCTREHRERKEMLEVAADEARGLLGGAAAVPGQRRQHRHLRQGK